LCYYIYNEVQNIVLNSLGPVSTAVGKGKWLLIVSFRLYMMYICCHTKFFSVMMTFFIETSSLFIII